MLRVPIPGEELCPSEQKIGAYSGFQANIYDSSPKGKAYYNMTHSQPSNKTVVHEMMCRSVAAADKKDMAFIQLVGNQPVYALILNTYWATSSPISEVSMLPYTIVGDGEAGAHYWIRKHTNF